nr:MAG TPA: hypothetical protein [Bacteriophage sp.]DAO41362.1 MAG TPA: hypothetical protein [Caudoviricetes sp.]
MLFSIKLRPLLDIVHLLIKIIFSFEIYIGRRNINNLYSCI